MTESATKVAARAVFSLFLFMLNKHRWLCDIVVVRVDLLTWILNANVDWFCFEIVF